MSDEQRTQSEFWSRLRAHPAFQAAVVFAGGSWLALQAADVFGLATDTVRVLGGLLVAVLVLLVGFSLFAVLRHDRPAVSVSVARVRARTAGLIAAALLVLGTGAWFARPYVMPPLRPGAEVIAVLPFNATGPGVELLGEGLVDLLSANLNEVGLLRTINPRTTLHQFDEVAGGGSIDLAGQLRVGRNVGAGSVLIGSVFSTGSEVRITAELYATESGSIIAKAQESGRPDSVLALVDQLSIELMQDIWRARAPLPALRVSAITSTSIPAIKAYLRGEQFYRRVLWDSAAAAFEEAVTHDSTFALAHFRLGETFGWRESLGSAQAQEHSDRAARFAERLPARERALIVAHQLHEQGRVEAIDSLQTYVSRFPDDVAGHYLLADARFHAGDLLGIELPALLDGFERVHELDPSFAPNYAHLIELAILVDDSARFHGFLADYREISAGEAEMYEAAGRIRWGAPDSALALLGRVLRAETPPRPPVIGRLSTTSTLRTFAETDLEFGLAALDTLAAATASTQLRNAAIGSKTTLLGSFGRMVDADRAAEPLRAQNVNLSLNFSLPLIFSGYAPDELFAAERRALIDAAERPSAAYWLAIRALMLGDTAAARRHIAVARTDTSQSGNPLMVDAVEGWLTVARGDTLGGIRALKTALLELGYEPRVLGPSSPLRVALAILQLTQPATRTEGIRRLEARLLQDPGAFPYVAAPLAEAYIADGRTQDAILLYQRFLELWQDADPGQQPRVDAARAALERLVGERAS